MNRWWLPASAGRLRPALSFRLKAEATSSGSADLFTRAEAPRYGCLNRDEGDLRLNITTLDWAILVAYLVIITAIGLIVGYRVRQTGEYFLGGRRFGPWLMIGQSFGVGTHAEMPVALAGAVYTHGASAIWYQWKNLFITPF